MLHVALPCWILSTPRTGSSYLAELLNSTGLFRIPFEEYYCGWEPWLEKTRVATPFFAKLHFSQFKTISGFKSLQEVFPKMNFVLIRRTNFHETALSWCYVFQTKIWNAKQCQQLPENTTITPELFLHFYQKARTEYHFWDEHLEGIYHLEVTYEQLVSSPLETTQIVLDHMGIKGEPNLTDGMIKLNYPDKDHYKRIVKALCGVT